MDNQLLPSNFNKRYLIRINSGQMSQINLPKSFCMFNPYVMQKNSLKRENNKPTQCQSLKCLKRQGIKVHLSVVKL